MKLNPLDIRRQQFARKTFGGYDTDEVDGFLKQLADQWEGALDEVRVATDRLQEAENKLRHYERVEMALQEALESTRESGRRAEALAEQKARLITDEAEMRARQIVQDAERDRHSLRQDLVTLTARQTEIGARLRGFLLSELEILAQFQGDDPVGFIKLQPAGQAVEARSLDAPVEPSRLVPHEPGRPDPSRADASRDAADGPPAAPAAAEQLPRETPAPPDHSADEPASAPHVSAEPTGRATPADAALDPGADEPRPSDPEASPSPAASSDVAPPAAAVPAAAVPAAAVPEPVSPETPSWAAGPASTPEPAPWTPAPQAAAPPAPAWPPAAPPPAAPPPVAPPAGIPAWAADLRAEAPAEPAAGSWDLRSLVTGGDANAAGSEAERERIRRILDDLD